MAALDDQPPPWEALPADALRHILALLPNAACRAAARATCTRWRQTADDSTEVWGVVSARQRQAAAAPAATAPAAAAHASAAPTRQQLAAVLGRQRQHLRRVHLELGCVADAGQEHAGQERPPSRELPAPPQLPGTAAQGLAQVLAAAVLEGSGLTDLSLAVPAVLPDCIAEALPGAAAQLTALTLAPLLRSGAALRWSQLGERLAGLHSLSLICDFASAGPPASLSALTALTLLRLQALPAGRGGLHDQQVGPALACAAPGLLRLELANVSVTSHDAQPAALADVVVGLGALGVIAALGGPDPGPGPPALAEGAGSDDDDLPIPGPPALDEGSGSDSGGDDDDLMPPGLASGGSDAGSGSGSDDDMPPPLFVVGASDASDDDEPPALFFSSDEDNDGEEVEWPPQRLLPKLLWERWQRLEALKLNGCIFRELAVLPRLPCLTSLHLGIESTTRRAVEAVLQCSHLQELVLSRYLDSSLPELPGGALQQLTRLRISGSRWLRELHPSWCALPALLSFEIESCERLRRLPAELTTLTGLQRIRFGHQRMEQLPTQVTGLSQLTRLAVSSCSLRELPDGPYLASLQELALQFNQLECVPPVLARASGLRLLDFSSNYNHQHLSSADVAVLAQLPALTLLDLSRQYGEGGEGTHPAEALAELRAALPHCEVRA